MRIINFSTVALFLNAFRTGAIAFLTAGMVFAGIFLVGDVIAADSAAVPTVEAQEEKKITPVFRATDDGPAPIPTHPPIDQIPPMPMPPPQEDRDELPDTKEPSGGGTYHNAITEETVIIPVDNLTLNGGFDQGGGYKGAYEGNEDPERMLATFAGMSQIAYTESSPWRMNVKVVMRFGSSYAVCSGTMRDAETVLTAGHCVYDYGGYGWADEIWVYPGWDGVGGQWNPPPSIINPYGYGHSTYFGAGTDWVTSGNLDADVGLVGITRAVGVLTGWFGWVYGGDCAWHMGKSYNNASYPAQNCPLPGLHNGLDMYYWWGGFDSCPWNQLQINTGGGNCFDTVWGGMSGSGAYYIDGNRYVHAVCSTSDRNTWGRYCRQWEGWVNWSNDTFIPNVRGSSFDLQPLDVNAEPAAIPAGENTTLLNHLATNPTNGSANGSWIFRVYLSTNDNISTLDTLLSTQGYSWNFGAMSSVRINMVQVTIPVDTPSGEYWLGLIYDSGTDGNSGNNDTDGWDPVRIEVTSPIAGYGDELAVDFGTNGLWHYDGSWSRLSNWNPEGGGLAGWSGGLAVDFGGSGLWNNDGSSWSRLSTWDVGDSAGLAGWSNGLAADFGANGLWNYDGTTWTKKSNWNPDSDMAGWSDGLAVDFGSSGLWNNDGSSWNKLSNWNPGSAGLAGWSNGLAVDFGGSGLWNNDGSSWSRMSNWNPENDLAGWPGGLAVDFGGNGLWNNDGSSWTRISNWNPEGMAGVADGLVVDFDGNGVWKYDGSSWSKLSNWNAENLSDCDLN